MRDERAVGAVSAERLLALMFRLSRDVVRTATWSEVAWQTLTAALTEVPTLACPLLLLDVTPLLLGERLQPLPTIPLQLRDAMRRYEDDVLAPLVAERRFALLRDAVSSLPRELRPVAVGLALGHVTERWAHAPAVGLSLTVVRRCAALEPAELHTLGEAALADAETVLLLAQLLLGAAQSARQQRSQLNDADVFLATHVTSLKQLAARVALQQVADEAQALDEVLPRRLKLGSFDDGDAPTRLLTESAFPVGGFSSLTNVGSMENLVTSELMFMDSESDGPDLFDVRFAQNELMFYARDEAVAVRRQRVISWVLDLSMTAARTLDAGQRHQRSVVGVALMVVAIRRLLEAFSSEALQFEVVVIDGNAAHSLDEERDVLQLMLATQLARGQVKVIRAATLEAALADAHRRHGVRGRQVVLAGRMPAGLSEDHRPDAVLLFNGAVPEALFAEPQSRADSHAPEALTSVAHVVERLLRRLMKAGRRSRARAVAHSRTA